MTFALTDTELTAVGAAYLLGCFTAGYYLVRWRTGQDVRQLGSGSTGARNVGRIIGPMGFVLTLLLDLGKGFLAVEIPIRLHSSVWCESLAMVAVVAGHVWPPQLRCQGGKGVAPSLGALLALDLFIPSILLVLCLAALVVLRNVILSGLLGYALTPLALLALGWHTPAIVGVSLVAMIILFAHRRNLREEIERWRGRK